MINKIISDEVGNTLPINENTEKDIVEKIKVGVKRRNKRIADSFKTKKVIPNLYGLIKCCLEIKNWCVLNEILI